MNTTKDTGSVYFTLPVSCGHHFELYFKASRGHLGATLEPIWGPQGQIWVMVVHQLGNAVEPNCFFASSSCKTSVTFVGRRVLDAGGSSSVASNSTRQVLGEEAAAAAAV